MRRSDSDQKKPPLSAKSPHPDGDAKKHWEAVHVCPKCGYQLNLSELDLKAITTGIVACPDCDRSEPIEIQIVDGKG